MHWTFLCMCEWPLARARCPLALLHKLPQFLLSGGCVFFAIVTHHAVRLVFLPAGQVCGGVCCTPKEFLARSSAPILFKASCAAAMFFAFQTYHFLCVAEVVISISWGEAVLRQHSSACCVRHQLTISTHGHALSLAPPKSHQVLFYPTGVFLPGQVDQLSLPTYVNIFDVYSDPI